MQQHVPRLLTDRLVLRPWRAEEAGIRRALWSERDPRVPAHRRLDAQGRPTVEELAERIRSTEAAFGIGLLALELKSTGEVVGYCGLTGNDYGENDQPEFAYELLQAHWGHGYATEAAAAIVSLARSTGFRMLWAGVRDWNTASRRVLSKLGFAETGRVEADPVHGDSLITLGCCCEHPGSSLLTDRCRADARSRWRVRRAQHHAARRARGSRLPGSATCLTAPP